MKDVKMTPEVQSKIYGNVIRTRCPEVMDYIGTREIDVTNQTLSIHDGTVSLSVDLPNGMNPCIRDRYGRDCSRFDTSGLQIIQAEIVPRIRTPGSLLSADLLVAEAWILQ